MKLSLVLLKIFHIITTWKFKLSLQTIEPNKLNVHGRELRSTIIQLVSFITAWLKLIITYFISLRWYIHAVRKTITIQEKTQ